MSGNEYYKRNREQILERAKLWYAENKDRKKNDAKNAIKQKAFLLAFLNNGLVYNGEYPTKH